jgi:monovalent cation/hydrogen antiporter
VLIRQWYELQLRRIEAPRDADTAPNSAELVRAAMQAERERLVQLRREGVIGDAAFQRVQEELDWAELSLKQLQ